MKKQVKKVNPYAKKATRKKIHITGKQWIAIGCVLVVLGTLIAFRSCQDPHAGHDHGPNGEHYEGDGHDHSTPNPNAKVKSQIHANSDKTFRLVFLDTADKVIAEFDKLPKQPSKVEVDKAQGLYEMGWATGSGSTEYECVYYNEKTGQVSKQFHAPHGTDGVRIAYSSQDQTKIIVEDLFDNKGYHKEHTLENAYNKNGNTVISGKLQTDKKTVLVSYYVNEKGESRHASVKLYE